MYILTQRQLLSAIVQSTLLQIQKHLPHLVVVWRPVASDRVPARTGRKALSTAARVPSNRHIVEHLWVLVDDRVQEPYRALALLQSLLIQQIDDAGEDGSRCRRSTNTVGPIEPYCRELESQRRDVGVGTAGGVEDRLVVFLGRVLVEVLLNCLLLPGWAREDTREAATRVVRKWAVG